MDLVSSQVFNNDPQGNRLRRRPKTDVGIVYKRINKFQIEKGVKNGSGWEKSVKETKVRIECSVI